jgi:hypothetical protein
MKFLRRRRQRLTHDWSRRSVLALLAGGAVVCCAMVLGVMTTQIEAQTQSEARLTIKHESFVYAQRRGYPLAIDATITSPAGISKAEVFCRPAGTRQFTALPMEHRGENQYRAVVPDWLTAGPGLEYYITATDQLGQSTSQGFVGFPLTVRLVSTQQPTKEERLKSLQDTLNLIRRSQQPQGNSQGYSDPLLDRNR